MPYDIEPYPDRGALRFLTHRDFGDVINVTFRFLRQNLRTLMVGQLYVAGPALVLVTASLFLFGGAEFFDPVATATMDPEELFASIGPSIVVTFAAYLLAWLLSFAAAFGTVRAYRRGDAGALRGADLWDETRPVLLPLLGLVGTMTGLFLLTIPVLIIPCLGALVVMGGFLYLIPALYLAFPARLFETDGAWAACKRGFDLAKTNWGRAFGTLFVAGILANVISLVAVIPGLVVLALAGTGGVEGGVVGTVLSSASAVLRLVALLVTNTFLAVLVSFLHGSLKEEGEGSTLHADLDRLAAGEASMADVLRDPADPLRDAPTDAPADDRFHPPSPPPPGPPPDPDGRTPDAEPRGDRGQDGRAGGFRGGGFSA